MKPDLIYQLWRSGFVSRWHCNDDWRLRQSGDMNGGHAQRVAILYWCLFGYKDQPTTVMHNLLVALLHDAPEVVSGDIPKPGKQRVPDLKVGDKAGDKTYWRSLHLPNFSHKSDEMNLCDLLDAIMFVSDRAPDLLNRADWRRDIEMCMAMAEGLGVADKVAKLIDAPLACEHGPLAFMDEEHEDET